MKSSLTALAATIVLLTPNLVHAELSVFDRAACIEGIKSLSSETLKSLGAEWSGLPMELWCPQFLIRFKKSASSQKPAEPARVEEAEAQGAGAAS